VESYQHFEPVPVVIERLPCEMRSIIACLRLQQCIVVLPDACTSLTAASPAFSRGSERGRDHPAPDALAQDVHGPFISEEMKHWQCPERTSELRFLFVVGA
jgi:hypothetical protein